MFKQKKEVHNDKKQLTLAPIIVSIFNCTLAATWSTVSSSISG